MIFALTDAWQYTFGLAPLRVAPVLRTQAPPERRFARALAPKTLRVRRASHCSLTVVVLKSSGIVGLEKRIPESFAFAGRHSEDKVYSLTIEIKITKHPNHTRQWGTGVCLRGSARCKSAGVDALKIKFILKQPYKKLGCSSKTYPRAHK